MVVFSNWNFDQLLKVFDVYANDHMLFISDQGEWHWHNQPDFGVDIVEWDQLQSLLLSEYHAGFKSLVSEPVDGQKIYLRFMARTGIRSFFVSYAHIPGQGAIYRWHDQSDVEALDHAKMHLTNHDPLTGLFNRAFFEAELKRLDGGRHFPTSVISLDLDGLRPVNVALGGVAGDEYIRSASALLQSSFRTEDILCRIGSDEFAAILPSTGGPGAQIVLDRIKNKVDDYNRQSHDYDLSFSIGVATVEGVGLLRETYLRADRRMQAEKMARKQRLK